MTGPLWRIVESDMHILDLAPIFTSLISWIGENISNPIQFLSGIGPKIPPIAQPNRNDQSYQCLLEGVRIEQQYTDRFLPMIIQQVMVASNIYFQRTCGDFLDGAYSTVVTGGDQQLRQETVSVLKSNRIPESVFG